MKKLISAGLLVMLITGSPGCTKKPEGSTGELAPLYSALHEIVLLKRQYKAGKINSADYNIKSSKLERIISAEFASHRQAVWDYSLNILRKTPLSSVTQEQLIRMTPTARWQAADEWAGDLKPLPAMFCMLPLEMTMPIIKPAFTPSEYNNFKYAFRHVQLLYLDDMNCTTAFLFGDKIAAVDFVRTGLRWKPGEIRLYIKPQAKEKKPSN